MQDIYLDSYHLHSLTTVLPSRVRQPVEGLDFPEVREDVFNRAGEHGSRTAHTLYGQRVISFQGVLTDASASDFRAVRQDFIAACSLQLDANNLPTARTLYLTDNAGEEYQVGVTTKKLVLKDTYPSYTEFMLDLTATDWRFVSQTLTSSTIELPQSGGITYPVTYPVQYGSGSGGLGTVENLGTAPAAPTIVINGPAINPVVTNQTTGEQFGLTLTLVAGDVITVDCGARTVVQGTSSGATSTTNRMGVKTSNSTFFSIQPGEVSLGFTADSYDTGTAEVSFRSSFVGL